MDGTVKWFDKQKGYGFISGSDGEEYFIHESSLPADTVLKENDSVTFEPTTTEKGKAAINVKVEQA